MNRRQQIAIALTVVAVCVLIAALIAQTWWTAIAMVLLIVGQGLNYRDAGARNRPRE